MNVSSTLSSVLHNAKTTYVNRMGFHTNQHLVLIESDDWGSIRMPSKRVYEDLIIEGDNPFSDPFLKYDSLESEQDLEELYDVLMSFKDSKGHFPCITANFAVANPKFDAIDYENDKYEYELFTDTYLQYYGCNNIVPLIKKGIEIKCFYPQLHTREHLNVIRWMKDLKNGSEYTIKAFNKRMIGIGRSFCKDNYFGYMDAFNYDNYEELILLKNVLSDSVHIFKSVFGFNPTSIVPPCYVWDENVEQIISRLGIKHIQTQEWQNIYSKATGTQKKKRKIHYTGEYNSKNDMLYTVRNCSFEPSIVKDSTNSINECMIEIDNSFKNKKPAIINSHRLNYIGGIDKSNRKRGLDSLYKLLKEIQRRYPDALFISSTELFNIIGKERLH